MRTAIFKPSIQKAYCLIIVVLLAVGGCYKTEVIPCNTCNSCMVIFAGKEVKINPQSVVCGSHALKPENPEREYYDFKGWFTDNDTYLNEWNFETDILTQDTTLYAKWERNTLEGTRWKLIAFVDVRTGNSIEPEPKDCEMCYTLFFDTDSTFKTYTFSNNYRGNFVIDFVTQIFFLTLFGGTKVGELPHGYMYSKPFWDYALHSFSYKENELKLFYFFNNEEKFFIFKSI